MVEFETSVQPWLTLGHGWAVYVGPVEPGRQHRHQAAQLAWCSHGTLTLEGAWGVLDTPGHFLPAGIAHRLVASQPVRMVFLDPTMLARVPSWSRPSVAALTTLHADLLEDELDRWQQGHQVSSDPVCSAPPAEDPRWAAVLRWLDSMLDGRVRVEDAATAVGLSSSRFMHWFAQVSGLTFRAYVRWLRLQRAVRTLSDGASLTEAAHLAGFADSAHLTRTFVATFGVRPATLRGARIVCVDHAQPPLTPRGLALVEVP
jgi:AraC-like DNA-binding protein